MKFSMKGLMGLLALALLAGAPAASAQAPKFGYANFEVMLSALPEARTVETELRTFQQKLQEQYQVKGNYFQGKAEEYEQQKAAGRMTPEQEQAAQKELQTLQEEVQRFGQESQANMQRRKEELLAPLLEKLKKGLTDFATAEGFTYIFSESAVLHAPTGENVTERVLGRMGIKLPAPGAAPAAGTGAGTGARPAGGAPAAGAPRAGAPAPAPAPKPR